ncbi:MAG: acyltransferase [Candidatus Levybacteria bacterium]|nr:acyltransferase [Candidatus Levybacteria bacterium]
MSNNKLIKKIDHGLPPNKYNSHSWIAGNPNIEEDVWIGAFTLIDAIYNSLKIGKGCNISSGAQIITHSTVKRCISENKYNKIESAPVKIGSYCFVGSNAVILMGSKIGHHSIIAAGAVVTEHSVIPPFSIVAGVPGKIIGSSKKFLKKEHQPLFLSVKNLIKNIYPKKY